jgi:glycosyltransferase involved in cell wall biosynthesis
MIFPDSALAHKYLDGLKGIEIGGSAHNRFNLKECLNVDFTTDSTKYSDEQVNMCGEVMHVDIVAPGDNLPFGDKSLDFVVSAHSLEHFYDPIKAIHEWARVVKDGGYIFVIFPHKERTFDKERQRTTFQELMDRFLSPPDLPQRNLDRHHTVWITEDALEFCRMLGMKVVEYQDVDDKVGNGFTFVIRMPINSRKSAFPRILVFSLESPTSASAQLRLRLPFARLKPDFDLVWMTGVPEQDMELLEFADLVVIQNFFPAAHTNSQMERICASGKPVIYEVDDLLFDVSPDNPHFDFSQARKQCVVDTLRRADAVVVSTKSLAERMRHYSDEVHLLPDLVEPELFHGEVSPAKGMVTMGVTGDGTQDADFALVAEALEKVFAKYGEKVRLIFMGTLPSRWAGIAGVEFYPFEPDYETYAARLGAAGIDIALAPLQDHSFNKVKSNIRWLEYSACGIPGIYSDTKPYEMVKHGETGLLVANSTQGWFEAICYLIDHPEKRRSVAVAAQEEVLRDWNVQSHAGRYSGVYKQLLREFLQKKIS